MFLSVFIVFVCLHLFLQSYVAIFVHCTMTIPAESLSVIYDAWLLPLVA